MLHRHATIAKMNSKVCQFIGLLVAACCLHELFNHYVSCPLSHVVDIRPVLHTDSPTIETTKRESVRPQRGRVHACVFTGRWMYLRILLPYLYRELRQNGGVVDRVMLVMIGYTEDTHVKLKIFVTAANRILKDQAFQFMYLKERADDPHVPASLFTMLSFNVFFGIRRTFISRWTTILFTSTRTFSVTC